MNLFQYEMIDTDIGHDFRKQKPRQYWRGFCLVVFLQLIYFYYVAFSNYCVRKLVAAWVKTCCCRLENIAFPVCNS